VIGRRIIELLLGLDDVRSVQSVNVRFDAPWASSAPAWVLFGCIALAALGVVSYVKLEPRVRGQSCFWLACLRAAVLALMFFIVADPVLELIYRETPRPLLYLVFDGSESMGIRDKFDGQEEEALRKAAGMPARREGGQPASRMEYLKAFLTKSDDNLIEQLAGRCRLRAFAIEGHGVRVLRTARKEDGAPDGAVIAADLEAIEPVTPIGAALESLRREHRREHLGGLVMFSDFNQNSGPDAYAPARELRKPIHTVGFGPAATRDLWVTISAAPLLRKAERGMILVVLRQSQLAGRSAAVRVAAQPLDSEGGIDKSRKPIELPEKSVTLRGAETIVEFPYVPDETGRFRLTTEVEPFEGETIDENNRASRDVNVRDDFMRLLYVAYEPNWEWRFIKEVFHRDRLVGMRGFRTFLHASDPDVRRSNPLFVPQIDMPRSEFFANDVIFLGDIPAVGLSTRFCEMVKEFVGTFGGGLVIIAGPVYGPGQLAGTPLADMLPVTADPRARRNDEGEFRMRLTPAASRFGFMRLGTTPEENAEAWNNMERLPWYQPAKKVHLLAEVLAEHPTDKCEDGKTPQPLIAVRPYGKGEVVYLALDEMWRLRRMFGEKYYRQFWGQMIDRLGLGHAVGSRKRFVVRTDRTRYEVDSDLRVTVEALDEDFRPLTRDKLPSGKLEGELIFTDENGKTRKPRPITIPIASEERGEFELSMPLLEAGDYRVSVKDHLTGEYADAVFAVTNVSAERQSAVRNVELEEGLADATHGKVYDLKTIGTLPDQLKFPDIEKTTARVFPLSSTWPCFGLLAALAVVEWAARKWINVP